MLEQLKLKADEIMKKQGNVRGDVLRDHFIYLKEKEGEKAVERMEKILDQIGYPLKFNEINVLEWYKDAYCGLILTIFKDEFNWSDKDIYQMGEKVVKYSFIVTRLILRYLVSTEKLLETASKQWRRHVDFGSMEVVSFKKKEKEIVLRVKDYDIHPLTCIYQSGYYAGIFKYTIKTKKITVKEQKCIHRGDDYHEYILTWE
jgi:predicted hydrocarbon binding protein